MKLQFTNNWKEGKAWPINLVMVQFWRVTHEMQGFKVGLLGFEVNLFWPIKRKKPIL